jgi:predicted branched-subunit amino acid permease
MTAVTTASPVDVRRAAAADGVRAMLPMVAGYLPFALVIGAAVGAHGDALAGWAGSWLIYGGSAHVATLRTLGRGGVLLAIGTGILVNTRLVVYSSSLAARWRGQPRWFRIAAAPLIIDPTWAIATARPPGPPAAERTFFLAAGATLGMAWSGFIALGVALGDALPADHLAVAVPLCLIALVAPRLAERDGRAVCVVAGAVAWFASTLPSGIGTLLAITAGTLAGGAIADRTPPGRRS